MKYKIVEGKLPWTDLGDWLFPEMDNRLSKSVSDNSLDVIDAVEIVTQHCPQMRSCVQAGGAVGVWPSRLAQLFDHVYTFEAHPDNHACLQRNLRGIDNVTSQNAALTDVSGETVRMMLDEGEASNAGAYFIRPGGDIPTVAIDDLGLTDCDLIYLDIEGAETQAIQGALETIQRCRPVIGLEEKEKSHLWEKYAHTRSPVDWLVEDYGYQVIERCHLDLILAPGEGNANSLH